MIPLCNVDDLDDPGAHEFSVGEGDWPLRGFVVRYRNQIHAYVNSCPHTGAQLNFKPHQFFAPDVELLQCTVHGARFLPLNGECIAGPCVGKRLQEMPVEVRGGSVWLIDDFINQPESAD